MHACAALDQLGARSDSVVATELAAHYAHVARESTDPLTVARATACVGFARCLIPGTTLAEGLAPVLAALPVLSDPLERVRVHYEVAQIITRTRNGTLFDLAERHYAAAVSALCAADLDPEMSSQGAAILNGRALLAYFSERYDEAIELARRSLRCLRRLPDSPEVWLHRMLVAWRTGDLFAKGLQAYREARCYYHLALRAARRTGDLSHVPAIAAALENISSTIRG